MNSPWSRIGEAERARRQAKRGSSRRKGKLGTRPDQNRSNAKLLPGMFKGPVNSGTCRRANSHWSAFAAIAVLSKRRLQYAGKLTAMLV